MKRVPPPSGCSVRTLRQVEIVKPTLIVMSTLAVLSISARTVMAGEPAGIPVEWGPVAGAANAKRTVVVDADSRGQMIRRDVQDGHDHRVRGVSLSQLLALVKAPKQVDAVIFGYADGMEIPVRLRDRDEVNAIFIALEHGDAMERYESSYPLLNGAQLHCPKIVYGRRVTSYSPWIYPGELSVIRLVTWKNYEAWLAQPTRRLPDRSGWPIYMQHCQTCHGIGGNGAKRGPDFLSDMDAYRRVPPMAVTDLSQPPSLHEKIKGYTDGTMPVLNQVPDKDIRTLWRWLHAIHDHAVH